MAPLNFRLSIGIRFCNRKLVFFSHLGYPKIQVVSATTVCALGNYSGNEKFNQYMLYKVGILVEFCYSLSDFSTVRPLNHCIHLIK